MESPHLIKTPFGNDDKEEDIKIKKEYQINYFSNILKIIIAKTKYNVIIRSSYYELKYNINDLSILTKIKFNSIDEAYEFIDNIFNQNKYYIKDISSEQIILIIKTYDVIKGKEKDIELYLTENLDNKNYLIKELFNKYNKIENELDIIKNDNRNIKEENNKLKQDNNNLKLEIELMKNNINNQNNQIGGLQMQTMNMINQIQQQIYNIMQMINKMKNEISSLSYSVNNSNLMNQFNNNSNLMNFSNNYNLKNENNLNKTNQFNSINNNIAQSENVISIKFRNQFVKQKTIDPINGELFLKISKITKNEYNIECGPDDKVHEMIEKYFEKTKINDYYKKYFTFIFDAKAIKNTSLTLKESGITNNNKTVFVFNIGGIKINFKISNDYLYIKTGIIALDTIKVYELIDNFLNETGIKAEDIKNYIYNNKIINERISLHYAGLYDNSDIIVKMNKPIQYIKIIFQSTDGIKSYNINCLKTEKIISIKRKIKEKAKANTRISNLYWGKEKKDDIFRSLEFEEIVYDEKSRAEEIGLKDNSVIYFEYEY